MPTLGFSPELKNYYSKHLLDRLVPALQHADHGLSEAVPSYKVSEYEEAVGKWQEFFGFDKYYRDPNRPENKPKIWDDGYAHAILSSCVT